MKIIFLVFMDATLVIVIPEMDWTHNYFVSLEKNAGEIPLIATIVLNAMSSNFMIHIFQEPEEPSNASLLLTLRPEKLSFSSFLIAHLKLFYILA